MFSPQVIQQFDQETTNIQKRITYLGKLKGDYLGAQALQKALDERLRLFNMQNQYSGSVHGPEDQPVLPPMPAMA